MKQKKLSRSLFEDKERTFQAKADGETLTVSTARRTSRFQGIIPFLSDVFSYTVSRSYGFLLLSFGVLTLLLNLSFSYFGFGQNDMASALIVGAVSCILALPFLFSDKPLCLLMQDFPPTSVFLFDFLCIRRQPRAMPKTVLPLWFCLLFGCLIAVIGFLFPLAYLLMAVGGILFLSLSLSSPEFPLLSALLLMPYLPLTGKMPLYLAGMIGIAYISFVRKVILGKRNYRFEKYDVLLILLAALFLVSGFLHGTESAKSAVVFALLTLSFPLVTNLISNPRLVECAENVLLVSAVPVGVLSVIKALGILEPGHRWQLILPSCGLFDSPAAYARFLIPVAVISLSLSSERRPAYEKSLYFFSFLLAIVNLICTLRFNAWVALLIGLFAVLFLNSKKVLSPLLLIPILLPCGLFFLPESAVTAFDRAVAWSDFSLSSLLESCNAMLSIVSDHFLIGIGPNAFTSPLSSYRLSTQGNQLLYLGCVAGIAAAGLLIALLAIRIRHRFRFRLFCHFSSLRSQNATVAATVYALFFLGMTENVGSSISDYFLFCILFGIGSALLRMSKKEYEERRTYYGNDDNSAESSGIDILIRN